MPGTDTDTVETQVETTPAPDTEMVDGEKFDAARAMRTIEKLRGEIKELKPKAKIADELSASEQKRKEAEMTELQKVQAELKETRKALKEKETNEKRQVAAQTVGLPLAFADRLRGETPEELEADAKKLLEALPKAPKTAPVNPTNPGGGAGPGETLEQKLARIYGTGASAWDEGMFKQKGGGVVFPNTE